MRIAVCLKHIPDGRLQIDPGAKRLVRSGSGEINKVDLNALEEALRLKDADGEIEVVSISMGPAKATDSLRTSLAIGSDRGILIADELIDLLLPVMFYWVRRWRWQQVHRSHTCEHLAELPRRIPSDDHQTQECPA